MTNEPWAPTHILGEDLFVVRELRGDKHFYPPVMAPEQCLVCGAPYGTCVDAHGRFVPLVDRQNVIDPLLMED